MISTPNLNAFKCHWLRDKSKFSGESQRPISFIALNYYNRGATDFVKKLLPRLPIELRGPVSSMILEYIVENQEALEKGLSTRSALVQQKPQNLPPAPQPECPT